MLSELCWCCVLGHRTVVATVKTTFLAQPLRFQLLLLFQPLYLSSTWRQRSAWNRQVVGEARAISPGQHVGIIVQFHLAL